MIRRVGIAIATLVAVSRVALAAERECLVAWHATGAPASAVTCRDGDVACDADGQPDGQCTVAVSACVLAAECAGATLTTLDVRGRDAALVAPSIAALPRPLVAPTCSTAASLQVKVGRSTTLRLRGGDGADVDQDRLRVRCRRATRGGLAVVVTTDFETGQLATVGVTPPRRVRERPQVIHEDAVVRTSPDWVFVVNRFLADNVLVLDPRHGLRTQLGCPTGPASNPHDVLGVRADKAYVTRYAERHLWIVNPSARACAGFKTGTIGLGDLADADGIPEMSQMALVGERLFVSIQRLDRDQGFQPVDASRLAVIDVTSDTLVGQIHLVGRNAFGDASGIQREPGTGKLVLAMAGNVYATGDGGIERVDPDAGSEGFIVTEDELGGSPTDVVAASPTRLFALVITESLRNVLVAFDLETRTATRLVTRDAYLPDVTLGPDGLLWLADLGPNVNGIRLFDPTTHAEVTAQPIRTGLPPFSIGFVP